MFLRFLNDDTLYPIKDTDGYNISANEVRFDTKLPEVNGGFDIIISNDVTSDFYRKFKTCYEVGDDYSIFTTDENTYYTYYLYQGGTGYVYDQITVTAPREDGLLRFSGKGKKFRYPDRTTLLDGDGFYIYKVVEGEMVTTTEEDKEPFMENKVAAAEAAARLAFTEAKASKIAEVTAACESAILSGVDIENAHYSYTMEDQNNILNSMQLAAQTGLAVPYHADGESCRLYEPNEIAAVYVAEMTNLTHHQTYFNQLRHMIDSLETIDEVQAVQYGVTELTGEYLDNYNNIMTHAAEIVKKFSGTEE